jgi:transglutaminase-like putative cysteine protease
MITPEDLKKEALEIEKELYTTKSEIKETRKPIYFILSLIMILILVIWIVPHYSVKIDPTPKNIPSYDEVIPTWLTSENSTDINPKNYDDYLLLYKPNDPSVKYVADLIAYKSCESNNVCYAKAIFQFLKNNFNYVNDPTYYEYVKDPIRSLETRSGDCDDASILLINLLGAVGIRTRLVFVPGHVYVQAYLPDAHKKYTEDGWVNLDVTCQSCKFGEFVKTEARRTMIEI